MPLTDYVSSPSNSIYCYAELAVSSLAVAETIATCQYSLRLSREGWTVWVDLVAWLNSKMVYPRTVPHPSTNRARRRATTLIETNVLPLSQAATAKKYSVFITSSWHNLGFCLLLVLTFVIAHNNDRNAVIKWCQCFLRCRDVLGVQCARLTVSSPCCCCCCWDDDDDDEWWSSVLTLGGNPFNTSLSAHRNYSRYNTILSFVKCHIIYVYQGSYLSPP